MGGLLARLRQEAENLLSEGLAIPTPAAASPVVTPALPTVSAAPAPSGPTAAQQQALAADIASALQAVLAPLLPAALVLPTGNLQNVAAGANLLQKPFSPPFAGALQIAVRVNVSAPGVALQISRDGSTWGTFNADGGGALSPGAEYTFSTIVRSGEAVQIAVASGTTLDVLDVIFVPPGQAIV